jgi:hypothetical protein
MKILRVAFAERADRASGYYFYIEWKAGDCLTAAYTRYVDSERYEDRDAVLIRAVEGLNESLEMYGVSFDVSQIRRYAR